ncbi:MAG: potassium-transporting ATPase subunit F [Thermodesulfobacteriota bacterium]
MMEVIALVIGGSLLVYLIVAVLRPEWF